MWKLVPWRNGWKINQWQKWESGNPKWRPRKLITDINKELEISGIEQIKNWQLNELILNLFQLTDIEVKNITKDKGIPIVIKILLKWMLNKKNGFDWFYKLVARVLWSTPEIKEIYWPDWSPLWINPARAFLKEVEEAKKRNKS